MAGLARQLVRLRRAAELSWGNSDRIFLRGVGIRVLIVEDGNALRAMYRMELALAGYDVWEANSGFAALQRLETVRPDLVVLDLVLPGVDGIAVLRDLAAQAHIRHVAVLVVTGSDLSTEGLPVACTLKKPISPMRLARQVRECLENPNVQP